MALNPVITVKSLPVARREVTLATLVGVKVYNRTFRRVESSLYLTEVLVRVRGRASRDFEAEIAAANRLIREEFEQVETLLAERQRALRKQLTRAGLNERQHAVGYTHPTRLELTTRTPEAMHYGRLLLQLETTARLVDTLWYQGLVDARRQLVETRELYRWMQRLAGRVEQLGMELAYRVSDELRAPRATYQALLRKKLGVAPEGGEPLQADEFSMSAREARSLAMTEVLAEALERLAAGETGEAAVEEPDVPAPEASRAESGVATSGVAAEIIDSGPETGEAEENPADGVGEGAETASRIKRLFGAGTGG